jgi:hypothetical protein
MVLHDSNSLLAPIASLLNLLGNFFAILLGIYDTNALWEERYLSGNTEDYYLHIFCWSLDEYGRARAVCWFLAIVAIGAPIGLFFRRVLLSPELRLCGGATCR